MSQKKTTVGLVRLSRTLYLVGIQSMRILKRWKRRTARFLRPVGRFLSRVWQATGGRWVGKLLREMRSVREGFSIAGKRLKTAKKKGALPVVKESFSVAGKGVIRHRNIWCTFLNIAAPVAAICVLLATVRYWNSLEFGLNLTYNGEMIGTIENEKVFEQATEMVSQRMVHDAAEQNESVSMTPVFSLTVSDSESYTVADAVCNKIIEQSDGIIEEATGLYIDGELIGAVKSSADLSHILEGILDEAKGDDEDATAVFAQTVDSVTGLFPTSTVISSQEMESELTATSQKAVTYVVQEGDTAFDIAQKNNMSLEELDSLNAGVADGMIHIGDVLTLQTAVSRLEVQIVKTETYQEALPYKTITQTDDSQYTDYSQVITEGSEGVQECVDRVTYVNGVEVSRENVSTTVLTPAVDRVVVTGTKERPKNSGIGTGNFIWPCPSLHVITTYYEYRWGSFHAALDISGGSAYGKPIVASDSGTVTAAGYSGSYGYRVIINHGNGMQTLYAHCSELLVSVGQKVNQGDTIALVGSTGNSTGAHCHFEIYVNGSRVDPLPYVT